MCDFSSVSNFKLKGAPIDKYLTSMTREEYKEYKKKKYKEKYGIETEDNCLSQYEELYYFNVKLLRLGLTEEEYFKKVHGEE